MRTPRCVLLLSLGLTIALTPALFGADGVARIFDGQVKALENDVLPLAEAMPADKDNFAPTAGSFQGVRTFSEQVRHLSTVIYMLSGAVLGEKPPVDIGKDDSGPASVRTKAQLVEYLRGALAFAHKAAGTLTEKNELDDVASPFGGGNEAHGRGVDDRLAQLRSFRADGGLCSHERSDPAIEPACAFRIGEEVEPSFFGGIAGKRDSPSFRVAS